MEQKPESENTSDARKEGDAGAGRRFPRLKGWERALTLLGTTLFFGSAYLYLSDTSLRELFWGETYEAGQSIGRIGAIRGNLKREFAESLAFRPIFRRSSVYNRDTLMTDANSTASVELNDGNVIELGPSTMVKLVAGSRSVFGGVEFPKVQMVSGNVKVRASTGEIRVRSRNQEIRVAKEMALQLSVASDGPSRNPSNSRLVQIGEAVPIERAVELKLPPPALPSPVATPKPSLIAAPAKSVEPSPSPVAPSPSPRPSPSPSPRKTVVPPKPSPKPKSKPTPKALPSPKPLPLPKPSPTPIVHIPIPTEPANDQAYSIKALQAKGTGILMTWHKAEGADGYMIEITRDEQMSKVVVKADLTNNFYVFKATAPGKYWWRVRSTRGENGEFDSRPSGVFRVIATP